MNDDTRARNQSGHWREDGFDWLKQIGREAGEYPAWAQYAQFCAELEGGLRKQALATLTEFISRLQGAPFAERRTFVSWLLGRIDQCAQRGMLAPHPLQKSLIEPTLAEWIAAEPLCSEPHRWLGGYDHLRRALQLDSSDEIARRKLVSVVIESIQYSAHELPQGYLGDATTDMALLGETEDAAMQLANVDERSAAVARIQQLEATIAAWLRSRSIDNTNRVYEQPQRLSAEELSHSLNSDDPMIVCSALISAALHDPDPLQVESLIVTYLQHPDDSIRRVSATAAGHLARIHRHKTDQIISLLQAMLRVLQTCGTAEDALDDIAMFTSKSKQIDYECLRCALEMRIWVTREEFDSALSDQRSDVCANCSQRIGLGPVTCRACGESFELAHSHWHVHCDLHNGICPRCGVQSLSPCIC